MNRSAPLTRTTYAWAVVSDKGFVVAVDHPCGIVTFPTDLEAIEYIAPLGPGLYAARIQITVKLAKVAK